MNFCLNEKEEYIEASKKEMKKYHDLDCLFEVKFDSLDDEQNKHDVIDEVLKNYGNWSCSFIIMGNYEVSHAENIYNEKVLFREYETINDFKEAIGLFDELDFVKIKIHDFVEHKIKVEDFSLMQIEDEYVIFKDGEAIATIVEEYEALALFLLDLLLRCERLGEYIGDGGE